MSAPITTTVSEAFVASITQAQDLTTRGIDAWSSLASKAPARPSLGSLPFSDQLPTPTQVVDSTFEVVEAIVASQKQIAGKLVGAAEPNES